MLREVGSKQISLLVTSLLAICHVQLKDFIVLKQSLLNIIYNFKHFNKINDLKPKCAEILAR